MLGERYRSAQTPRASFPFKPDKYPAKLHYYDVTTKSGPGNGGTVYELSSRGTFSVLYSFTGSPSDGANPTTPILGSDSNFYGMTTGGGIQTGGGTVFELTASGDESVLYSFNTPPA